MCGINGDFVIIGVSLAQATVGALHVASFDGHALQYVGTGFSGTVAAIRRQKLDAIAVPGFAVPGSKMTGAVWVSPDLRAAVAYCSVTTVGELRHASFKALVEP